MIIRRKPMGFQSLRKPQSLGMSLLRNSVSRLQSLTIRRVPQGDQPIDWGEGVPDDIYDTPGEGMDVVDADLAPDPDFPSFNFAQSGSEPASTPRRPRQAAQRATAQRQPAASSAAPSKGSLPMDLKAILEGHRKAGHLKDDPSQHALNKVSPAFSPEALTQQTASKDADHAPSSGPVQRTPAERSGDEPPRPRRRGHIVDVTPVRKGLPLTDLPADEVNSVGGIPAPSAAAPLGAPIQRKLEPAETAPVEDGNAAFLEALARASAGAASSEPELANAPEPPAAYTFDPGATLTDLGVPRSPVQRTPEQTYRRPEPAAYSQPAGYTARTDLPAGSDAPEPSVESSDFDASADDSEPARAAFAADNFDSSDSSLTATPSVPAIQRTADVQRAAALDAAIRRAESVTPRESDAGGDSVPDSPTPATTRPPRTIQRQSDTPRMTVERHVDESAEGSEEPGVQRSVEAPRMTVERHADESGEGSEEPAVQRSVDAPRMTVQRHADESGEGSEEPAVQRSVDAPRMTVERHVDEFAEGSEEPGVQRSVDAPRMTVQRHVDEFAEGSEEPGVQRSVDAPRMTVERHVDEFAEGSEEPAVQRSVAGDQPGSVPDPFEAPYTPDDPHFAAFQAALQRVTSPAPPEAPETPEADFAERSVQSPSAASPNRETLPAPVQRTPRTPLDISEASHDEPAGSEMSAEMEQHQASTPPAISQAAFESEPPELPFRDADEFTSTAPDGPDAHPAAIQRSPAPNQSDSSPDAFESPYTPDSPQYAAFQSALQRAESPATVEPDGTAVAEPSFPAEIESPSPAQPATRSGRPTVQASRQTARTPDFPPELPEMPVEDSAPDLSYSYDDQTQGAEPNDDAPRAQRIPSAHSNDIQRSPESDKLDSPYASGDPHAAAFEAALRRAEAPAFDSDVSETELPPARPDADQIASRSQASRAPSAAQPVRRTLARVPRLRTTSSPAQPLIQTVRAPRSSATLEQPTVQPARRLTGARFPLAEPPVWTPLSAETESESFEASPESGFEAGPDAAATDFAAPGSRDFGPARSTGGRAIQRFAADEILAASDMEGAQNAAPAVEPPARSRSGRRSAPVQRMPRPGAQPGSREFIPGRFLQRVPSLEEEAAGVPDSYEPAAEAGYDSAGIETPDWSLANQALEVEARRTLSGASLQRTPDELAMEDPSAPSTVEAGLLGMLGLPADTAIARGSETVSKSGPSATPGAVQRALPNAPQQGQTAQQTPIIHADQVIIAPPPAAQDQQASSGPDASAVESMAQAVYRVLRNRLKIDRERSQGRPR